MQNSFVRQKVFVLCCACLFMIPVLSITSYAQEKVKESATDKSYNVSGFHGIEVSGGFDVILYQGDKEGVVLTARENLFASFSVEVYDGILKISSKGNVYPTGPMKAQITFRDIDKIRVSGGGDVLFKTTARVQKMDLVLSGGGDLVAGFKASELHGTISGGGDAVINGDIKLLDIQMSGGGDLLSEIKASEIRCTVSGGGDFSVNCIEPLLYAGIAMSGGGDIDMNLNAEKLNLTLSGGGDAQLNGSSSLLEVAVSGGGDVDAGKLQAKKITFSASGGSDIRLNVSDELKGSVSGGGNVYYSGNPGMVEIDKKGGSQVFKE